MQTQEKKVPLLIFVLLLESSLFVIDPNKLIIYLSTGLQLLRCFFKFMI